MNEKHSNIFYAKNLSDLFYQIKTISGLEIVGACTGISSMPEKCISTTLIKDFKQIQKHERYIEFGPGTSLASILELGERNLPKLLPEAIESVSNPFVRNIATIAGNLFNPHKGTLLGPLLALDAYLELKSPNETKYTPLINFTEIPKGFVVTNIRIPVNDWDVSIFKRLGPENKLSEDSATFSFLSDSEKSVITNLKIAFSGKITFRCQELENKMLGAKLPLPASEIGSYVEEASEQFDRSAGKTEYNPVLRQQFKNLVLYSFEQLI